MDLITLLKANIRYRKGSFISVLILSFIISVCLVSILSINYNIAARAEDSLKEIHAGDLVSIIWDVNFTDEMRQKLEDDQNIDHMNEVKSITQKLEINKIEAGSSTFFEAYNKNEMNYHIFQDDGKSFQTNPEDLKPGEIYVPISFERLYQCHIGDVAHLTAGEQIKSFVIKGYFEEPLFGCEAVGIKIALMNQEDFNELYAGRTLSKEVRDQNPDGILAYHLVHMNFNEDTQLNISELRKEINQTTEIIDYSLFTVSKEQSKSMSLMFAQIVSGIMLVFLILLLAVIMIVIGHSISTGIEMDYTNLGVLKAIGFGKSKLRQVFVLEYLLAELIGMILGIAGSIPAIYYLNTIFIRMTGLLSSVKPAYAVCLLLLTLIIVLSALFIYIKTRVIARVSPIYAVSGGRDSVYFHSRIELPVEGRGLYIKMAFRQLTSNLRQYISSTVIVTILVFFLVTITLLGTSMNEQTIEDCFGVNFSDIEIGYDPQWDKVQNEIDDLRAQVEADISDISTIKSSFKIGSRYFTVNGDEYHVTIYEDPGMVKSILKGRAPLYDNEIVITKVVADELGVQVGDTVTVGNIDLEAEYMVSGFFQSTTDLGRAFAMNYEGAQKLLEDYHMNYVQYKLTEPEQSGAVVEMLMKKYGDQIAAEDENTMMDFGDTIIQAMGILNIIIYAISILFGFLVIVIVCGKVFIKERMDYGIYKALGFTSPILRLQFALRFALIGFIGGILGVMLNLCFNNMMMSALLINIGISSFESRYNVISIVMPITVLTSCFFVFAYFVSRKIRKVDTKNLISDN